MMVVAAPSNYRPCLKAMREPCCTFHLRNYSDCWWFMWSEGGGVKLIIVGIYYFKRKSRKRKMYISSRMFGLILNLWLYQMK